MAPPRSAVAQKLREQDPTLLPSEDEEDDSDFRLSDSELARNHDAGSSSSSSSGSDGEQGGKVPAKKIKKKNKATKRKRGRADEPVAAVAVPPPPPVVDVDDLWAQFNAQDDDPYASKPSASASAAPAVATTTKGNIKGKAKADNQDRDDLVSIQIEYEFAGEKVQQQKKVKRSSAEAQAYFARNPTAAARTSAVPPPKKDPTYASLDALFGPNDSTSNPVPSSVAAASAPAATTNPAPTAAGSAPKRRRVGGGGGGLAGVAASLGVGPGGKPAKLNTLEKSKLDWTSYVSSETGLEDTLAHARKDGYLDRRDFLDRVDQSKEEQWDKARQAGRRR